MCALTPELDGKILGVNDRAVPHERPFSYVTMRVVLVGGAVGDYAAYIGCGSIEFVKQYGNKLRFEEACCHFPDGQLERERYRE